MKNKRKNKKIKFINPSTHTLTYPTQLDIRKIFHCSVLFKCHTTKLQTVPKICTTFPITWACYPSLQTHWFKWCPYLWATCPCFWDNWHWLNQFFVVNHTLKLGSQNFLFGYNLFKTNLIFPTWSCLARKILSRKCCPGTWACCPNMGVHILGFGK